MPLGGKLADFDQADDENQGLPAKLPDMITIPAGSFWMGTSDQHIQTLLDKEDWASEWHNSDLFMAELPAHQVTLNTYQIAKYPVTNAEYYVFIFNTGYKVPKNWTGFKFPEGLETHPVTGVSRMDAEAYIQWLNKSSGSRYRLPSEAEWEKAARGPESRIYPWGDNFDPWRCNTIESGKKLTTPVGSYSPGGDSVFEVADMVGNVWEWTHSLYAKYPYDAKDGREDEAGQGRRVLRGGSFGSDRHYARCACRNDGYPGRRVNFIGFRVCVVPHR